MVNSLFVNSCIFITFLFFSGVLSKKYVIGVHSLSLFVRTSSGLLFGLYGIILMNYSFSVGPHSMADMRHLCIVVVAVYMGWFPSILCAVVLCLARLTIFGWSSAGLVASAGMLLIGILCGLISLRPWSRLIKMNVMNLVSMLIIFISLRINLKSLHTVMTFYPTQFFIAIAGCLLVYAITEHIYSSNELFAQLEKRASTDHLTQLNNLRQFEWSLRTELSHARIRGDKLSLLIIDIDHFKKVNDTYGHLAGDAVLKELGNILVTHARPFDIVSRNGGEEFTILLIDCPDINAIIMGEKIRKAVQAHSFKILDDNHKRLNITVSIGVSTYPDCAEGIDPTSPQGEQSLIEQADKALYQAKNNGRNRVCSFKRQLIFALESDK
ncbi:GGDEF domain-containing protein [Paenibacillus pini]|uniref:GAF domain/GGDEF domain protein n=1 Tax=Paenibacillus pini JCM 16418 TaxID=1236976 RepID=W7YGS5_9BACL|nr:diguanylate cyclase [Paenibacillus pini]GAF10120.1 GAF domain/GGDEF domain protein [Paenibacillus pini JCM 16418]